MTIFVTSPRNRMTVMKWICEKKASKIQLCIAFILAILFLSIRNLSYLTATSTTGNTIYANNVTVINNLLVNPPISAIQAHEVMVPQINATSALSTAPLVPVLSLHYSCSLASIESYLRVLKLAGIAIKESNSKLRLSCNCFELLNHDSNAPVSRDAPSASNRTASLSFICLPTYFIIGVSKSGTSSLYYYLSQDPRFVPGHDKETWRINVPFADDYAEDIPPRRKSNKLRAYVRNFIYNGQFELDGSSNNYAFNSVESFGHSLQDLQRNFMRRKSTLPVHIVESTKSRNKMSAVSGKYALMTGDATPEYHVYADAPRGMAKYFPTARIIVLAREPMERALSSYVFCGLGNAATPKDSDGSNFLAFLNSTRLHKAEYELCRRNSVEAKEDIKLPQTNEQWTVALPGINPTRGPTHPGTYANYLALLEKVHSVTNPCHFQPFINNHHNYFARSAVLHHLQWWRQYYPAKQLLLIDYSLLNTDAYSVYKDTLAFLGMTPHLQSSNPLFKVKFMGPSDIQRSDPPADFKSKAWYKRRFDSSTLTPSRWEEAENAFKEYSLDEQFNKVEIDLGVRVLR